MPPIESKYHKSRRQCATTDVMTAMTLLNTSLRWSYVSNKQHHSKRHARTGQDTFCKRTCASASAEGEFAAIREQTNQSASFTQIATQSTAIVIAVMFRSGRWLLMPAINVSTDFCMTSIAAPEIHPH